jgi:hypothetical protein
MSDEVISGTVAGFLIIGITVWWVFSEGDKK